MSTDAKEIMQCAKVFLIASNRCQEQRLMPNGQLEWPMIPAVVCMAFSVELHFKAIIKAQGNEAKGHKLYDLYSMISIPASTLIVTLAGYSDEVFRCKLSVVTNAFVEWRYIYEKGALEIDVNFLKKLSSAAQEVSEELIT